MFRHYQICKKKIKKNIRRHKNAAGEFYMLKITRILKRFLRSIIDFIFLNIFFTTFDDGKYNV